jgi:glutamyl-tRNA reductase
MKQVFVTGINHQTTETDRRLLYSLNETSVCSMYAKAKPLLPSGCFILNTCNRTEMYGCGDPLTAIELLLREKGLSEEYRDDFFILQGEAALQYMCRVAAGLESQVLGDLEVLGQFKSAIRLSKLQGCLTSFMERMTNCAISASKAVRSQTAISSGTASLAYAVARLIQQADDLPVQPRILLLGTGQFGQQILKNLKDYCPNASLSLCNRTVERAVQLSNEYGGLAVYDFTDLSFALSAHDVVISAAAVGEEYLINESQHNELLNVKLLIDTAVPYSIQPDLPAKLPELRLETLETLSKVVESDMQQRRQGIPAALAIIEAQVAAFMDWAKIAIQSETIVFWRDLMNDVGVQCPTLRSMNIAQRRKFIRDSMVGFIDFLKEEIQLTGQKEVIVAQYMRHNNKAVCCSKHNNCIYRLLHNNYTAEAC